VAKVLGHGRSIARRIATSAKPLPSTASFALTDAATSGLDWTSGGASGQALPRKIHGSNEHSRNIRPRHGLARCTGYDQAYVSVSGLRAIACWCVLGPEIRSSMIPSQPAPARLIRWHLHQRCDQAQQCLLFRPIPTAQELAQLNVGQSAPRRGVGLVNDESTAAGRLAPEEPCIAVRAAIEFSPVRPSSSVGQYTRSHNSGHFTNQLDICENFGKLHRAQINNKGKRKLLLIIARIRRHLRPRDRRIVNKCNLRG
jgi:hypothetical protein